MNDVRFALRQLLKRPGLTAAAILALALGTGANTAVFSIVNGVLLRPLPYPESDRLVRLYTSSTRNPQLRIPVSFGNFRDWQDQNQVFEHLALYSGTSLTLTDSAEPEQIEGLAITANLFALLGIQPVLGRGFSPEENRSGAGGVVILSHGLWQRRFGADPGVIGRRLKLNDETRTVVGVLPLNFTFSGSTAELWVPLDLDHQEPSRLAYALWAIGRLRPGVMLEQAQAGMNAIAQRLEQQYPATNAEGAVALVPLSESLVGGVRLLLFLLLGAVVFVLLIACTNVANLLLARAATRQREIAVRQSLGAGRFRIARQFLAESLLLSLLGSVAGFFIAVWAMDGLLALSPTDIPRREEIRLDSRVLAFTFFVSILTGLAFGLAPAWQATRTDVNEWLKESGRGALGGVRRHRLHSALIVSEVALALVLMIGAGLVLRSLVRVYKVHPGFHTDGVLTARLSLPATRYTNALQRVAFCEEVLSRVGALAGVQSAALTSDLPLTGFGIMRPFHIEGRAHASPKDYTYARIHVVSASYCRTMGIPVVQGRDLTARDNSNASRAALINQAMARRFFPGEDPIGKRLKQDTGPESEFPWFTIVGVVGDTRFLGLDQEAQPEWYRSYLQTPSTGMSLAVRTQPKPLSLAALIKREVQAIDKDQPFAAARTMEQLLSASLGWWRFMMALLGLFASLALVLAAVGIYGVMSYLVTQRTQEIGIRIALGARPRDVLHLVARQGAVLALTGVVIGLAGAVGLTRLMSRFLFGLSALDPATFGSISLLLVGIALLACFLPARRAAKVDPMTALRYE